ncbi:DUF2267 domain-containing protein [Streptomyces sp. NPDC020875]|uniref:DUF2267 domain-containing protein n=1 Tax=Streptomyces sp. NPDC020875 TaxID=3154898 RepID=UPI0033EC8D05
MPDNAFLDAVRERGEYNGREEAAVVSHAVLAVLGQHLGPHDAYRLATQLPDRPAGTLRAASGNEPENLDADTFCERVDRHTGRRPRTPRWDIHAVLSTLADTLTPTERDLLRTRLPDSLGALLDPQPPS